jgi:hypothetical protein
LRGAGGRMRVVRPLPSGCWCCYVLAWLGAYPGLLVKTPRPP